MDFNHNNVRAEDRLSSLPDELIHKILSSFDMNFAVQTCLLSSRWEFIWKLVPCLNFSDKHFGSLSKFANFVTDVLSHRNHQIEVSLVKLDFDGAANQVFVKKFANYAFSHNVQELTVFYKSSSHHEFPPSLFSSQSLKHLTLVCGWYFSLKTPLDFPVLTTLNLSHITLWGDIFSKYVKLKNLTLEYFNIRDMEVFDITTPRLSNLMLIGGNGVEAINVIAPQLENLIIRHCKIKYLNAPPGLSSFCYTSELWRSCGVLQFSNGLFHSLNKLSICLSSYHPKVPYKKEDARKIINMLQQLRSARYLTLNTEIVECISLFPDMLSHHPSPFSNLICLTIDYSNKRDAFQVTISSEVRNFFLENSPSPKIILELPKVPSRKRWVLKAYIVAFIYLWWITESQNPI